MTLAEFAHLIDSDSKWVLNTTTALRLSRKYSVQLAQRLTVARTIHEQAGVPLARAFALAGQALSAWTHGSTRVILSAAPDGDVTLTLDIHRMLSSFSVRLASLQTSHAPRHRGRRRMRRHDPLRAATEWGIDLTLVADNLVKTPEQRLRQLDAMSSHVLGVRRRSASGA